MTFKGKIVNQLTMWCAKCDNFKEFSLGNQSRSDAHKQAQADGWKYFRKLGGWHCLDCVNKKRVN